jgi:outer membrane immunogenic protein
MGSMQVIRRCGVVVAAFGLLVLTPGDAAADGQVVGVTNVQYAADWSGFYVGGQLGGAWNDIGWNQTNANYFNTNGAIVVGNASGFDSSGVLGGILAGGNIQVGRWIFGVELAANATDLSDSRVSPFFPATDTFATEINWLGTIEGRIGRSWDRWLFFASGGWATGQVRLNLRDRVALVVAEADDWAQGWTIGGGAEYLLWPSVAVGLEYDYMDLSLDGKLVSCPGCGQGVGFGTPLISSEITVQAVTARLSFLLTPED